MMVKIGAFFDFAQDSSILSLGSTLQKVRL